MAEFDQATTGIEHEWAASILLAEDEPLVRWDIAERLRDVGWHVVEAGSADAGTELLKAGTKVDLVLTDINMPGDTDGLGLALFAATIPGVKIVLMSGVPSSLIPGIEKAPKNHSFITKPFDDATMIASIAPLLGRNDGERGDVTAS